MTTAHERLMAEVIATMAANTRTPLHDIKVTVGCADLDRELGTLRGMKEALVKIRRWALAVEGAGADLILSAADDALEASGTLTEGRDVEQAPGDSLSGPTLEEGDAR